MEIFILELIFDVAIIVVLLLLIIASIAMSITRIWKAYIAKKNETMKKDK